MIYGMYLSTAGAKAQSNRLDVVANNIANVDTTGFRRQFSIARARLDHLSERGYAGPFAADDPRNMGGGVDLARTVSDSVTSGPLKPSSSPFHMAISGPGYFRVEQDHQKFLTRNGSFSMRADGTLLTGNGKGTLLSTDGAEIRIDPSFPFEVTDDNRVTQSGHSVATIAVVNPKRVDSLEARGEGLYAYDGFDEPSVGKVNQGYLEGSNIEPVNEMTDLIETARAFELNIQMVQLQSDSVSQLVGQVPTPVT